MQSSAESTSPQSVPFSDSSTPSSPPPAPSSPRRRGRPRRLNETELGKICAYVSGGLGLEEAAEYVRCSVNTIRREAIRNPQFEKDLHDAMLRAQLHPLRAMQKAVATHWRAAAWMLERMFPERFGRPDPGSFGARDARRLMEEVLRIVKDEMFQNFLQGPAAIDDVAKRIEATFEYYLHRATGCQRTRRGLRRSTQLEELKNRPADRFTESGVRIPTADEILRSLNAFQSKPSRPATPTKPPAPRPTERPAVSPGERPAVRPVERSAENLAEPSVASAVKPSPVRRGSPDPAASPTAGLLPTSPANPHSPQRPSQNPPGEYTHSDRKVFRELFGMLSEDVFELPPEDAPKTPDSAPHKTQ